MLLIRPKLSWKIKKCVIEAKKKSKFIKQNAYFDRSGELKRSSSLLSSSPWTQQLRSFQFQSLHLAKSVPFSLRAEEIEMNIMTDTTPRTQMDAIYGEKSGCNFDKLNQIWLAYKWFAFLTNFWLLWRSFFVLKFISGFGCYCTAISFWQPMENSCMPML